MARTIIISIIAVAILSLSLLTLAGEKQKPVAYKDDSRISVRINTEVIMDAWDSYPNKEEWGEMDTEPWLQLFDKEMIIEAMPGQKFHEILVADNSAAKIAEDFPDLFKLEQEGEKYVFTMEREQGGKFVVMPTWILVKLIDGGVLKLPN